MKINANAKINLGLDIVGEREDGYHLLDMIMVPLRLHDEVEMELAEKDSFESNTSLNWDKGNLMYRAAELMRKEYGLSQHFKIRLDKKIPMQAGLAGGSADCAAVIKGINELCNLQLSMNQLCQIGVRLGADVPYCLHNKPSRVQGIGEIVKEINIKNRYFVLLVKPEEGVSTKEVYQRYDSNRHVDIDALEGQLKEGKPLKLGNVLEDSAFELLPEIKKIKETAQLMGYEETLMSGSGSCVFVLSDCPKKLEKINRYMKKQYNFVLISEIAGN